MAFEAIYRAVAYTHRPTSSKLKPIGQNGLPFNDQLITDPFLHIPDTCSVGDFYLKWSKVQSTHPEHLLQGRRFEAYNELAGTTFSLGVAENRDRLRRTEELWTQGKAAMDIETAYWEACYERRHSPLKFTKREKYLRMEYELQRAAATLGEIEVKRRHVTELAEALAIKHCRKASLGDNDTMYLAELLHSLSVKVGDAAASNAWRGEKRDDADDESSDDGLEEAMLDAFERLDELEEGQHGDSMVVESGKAGPEEQKEEQHVVSWLGRMGLV